MIVLTGATGGLGSQVLKYITKRVPAHDLVVATPDPARARTIGTIPPGVAIREADFHRAETLSTAFAGADALLLVSYPSIAHDLRVELHKRAIDAAKAAGVRRIYYTSLAFGRKEDGRSVAEVMQAHLDTEAYLEQSGVSYTIIREGLYAESYPLYLGFFNAAKDTEVYVPGDGPISWAAREDLGEATAKIIAEDLFPNETVLLSGPSSNTRTVVQVAGIISDLLSEHQPQRHEVRVHIVSEDDFVARHAKPETANMRDSPEFLHKWATTYEAMKRGETGIASPLLEKLLGRSAKSIEERLREMLGKESEITQRYAK